VTEAGRIALLTRVLSAGSRGGRGVEVGIGDDAAVLSLASLGSRGGRRLV
jgi:hypothetical protein